MPAFHIGRVAGYYTSTIRATGRAGLVRLFGVKRRVD